MIHRIFVILLVLCVCAPVLAQQPAEKPADADPKRLWCNEHGLYEDECLICHAELRDPKRLWCNEHSRYEDECLICHAELRDPKRLWCNEHGLYEDECLICHPELAKPQEPDDSAPGPKVERDQKRLWCNEHSVYEDECFICHPELAPRTGMQGPPDILWCGEHDLAESECGICHPELIADLSPGQGLKVRFESMQSATKAGVQLGVPEERTVLQGGRVFARVSYDRNSLAVVTPLADGVLDEVHVDVGDEVEAGQLLATINSRELASAKSALVMALADERLAASVYARQKDLHAEDVATQQQLDESRAASEARRSEVDRARQHLLNLGLTEAEVSEVAQSGSASSKLPLRAPFAGTVVERTAVTGSAVEMGDMLFEIADLSKMWLEISVPESQMGQFQRETVVAAEFDAYPGQTFDGTITWAAQRVDEHTRMLEVRAEIVNADRKLKHGMFGRVNVAPENVSRLSVPVDAVQVIDGRTVVFAKLADDLYETRVVKVGGSSDGWSAIVSGLNPQDEIAIAETYVLKSELLKARLGAGCTDH